MMLFVISPPPPKCSVLKKRVSSKSERSYLTLDHRRLRRGLKNMNQCVIHITCLKVLYELSYVNLTTTL